MDTIIGYTTANSTNTVTQLTGIELAKRDLSNHFAIRKGEKWTNPEFGSNLPYYIMEPLDDATVQLINDDVTDVISYDPRFEVTEKKVLVQEDDSFVTVICTLIYVPTTTVTELQLKFDREAGILQEI
jgi:phage baseplate assembly protein W